MKLSEAGKNRDNNFSLIRIVAALVVIYDHSFDLATGTGDAEPIEKLTHVSPGLIALDVFFVTSGFLVAGSLLKRRSAIEFFWARMLRIYPALLVNVFLIVFGLGLLLTSLPLADYLRNVETYHYLARNSILVLGITHTLPGLFLNNPYPNAVNGSLWTLPYEMLIYGILAAAWLLPIPLPKYRLPIFKTTIVALAITMGTLDIAAHFAGLSLGPTPRLLFMFFTSAAFYVFKEKIVLSRALFWICIVALAVSLLKIDVYFIVYRLTLAYCLMYIVFVPGGFIREYNKLGDFSYGTYIYAFPIQQTIASLIPGISVPTMFVISTIVTIPLAVTSWHLIEKRALTLKDYSVHFTQRFLHSS